MRIVVAGATGFIGRRLIHRLGHDGHSVTVLSRRVIAPHEFPQGITSVSWDPATTLPWGQVIDKCDAVVNLAGEPLSGGRWTERQKRRILESRVRSTRSIVEAIGAATQPPRILVNASAVGYYGDVPEGDVTETRPVGEGFLAETCARWEEEAFRATAFDVRVIALRTGVVLDAHGGVLPQMALPFRFFAGGIPGSGRQWFPWVHRDDVVRAILFAIGEAGLAGAVNLAAPEPHTMASFSRTLGTVMGRPCWLRVPSSLLRLLLGEMSMIILAGQRIVPRRLLDAGFAFTYPQLRPALESILRGA